MRHYLILLTCLLSTPFIARAADTSPDADAMIKQFETEKAPAFDTTKRDDQEYVKNYIAQSNAYNEKRAQFAKDFAAKYPDDPRTFNLLKDRWTILCSSGKADEALAEIDPMLKDAKDDARRVDLLYAKAGVKMRSSGRDSEATVAAVEEFIKAAPKDDRGASMLMGMMMSQRDKDKQAALRNRIIENYPDSPAAKMAKGLARQDAGIGKPFDLSFTEAVSGKNMSMSDLKGKVVVIDFWATWCGPCVAEMPKMKKLYAEYKDKGVEFVGVSLDQPDEGLKALKAFVAKNEITWPQYYQGNGWNSEFSSGWGINSIPCVFVIDKEGKLYSTKARGQLEKMIPELLSGKAKPEVGG
jgi:thiol-disulfide isomerase/thioredoxin